MRGLSILVILLIAFYLIGCANTAMVEDAKKDSDYHKSLLSYHKNQIEDKKQDYAKESVKIQHCEPVEDGIITSMIKEWFSSDDWEDVVLEKHELPKYTTIDLNGRTIYLYDDSENNEGSFQAWYDKEIQKAKKYKYYSKHNIDYDCYTKFEERAVPTGIEVPQEWIDQWNKESQVETHVEQAQIKLELNDSELFDLTAK